MISARPSPGLPGSRKPNAWSRCQHEVHRGRPVARRLAREIAALGGEAVHTLDLPSANRTTDAEIMALAAREQRTVVTKDSDFVDFLFLRDEPEKLLLIATGNIPNDELCQLLRDNWSQILALLEQGRFVELSRTAILLHF